MPMDFIEEIPKRERARMLLDEFELRLEQARAHARVCCLEGRLARQDASPRRGCRGTGLCCVASCSGCLNPVLIHGQYTPADEVRCRAKGCPTWVSRREAFDQMGFCRNHYEIATGRAEPPGPTDLERMIDSVT